MVAMYSVVLLGLFALLVFRHEHFSAQMQAKLGGNRSAPVNYNHF